MKVLKLFGHLIIIIVLTVVTQVGGLIWLVSIIISSFKNWNKRYVFTIIYLIFNLILVPPVAAYFGREELPWFNENLEAKIIFYPLAFRNYVKPELKNLLFESSKSSNIKITYLDANFPFLDGFPLLPHLSHDDGEKIDLSFQYTNKDGSKTDKKPSFFGYGAYVKTKNVTSDNCLNKGYWQYDFTKYLNLGENNDLKFDSNSTRELITSLLNQSNTQKIFIKPYLKKSLRLENESKIRFHGCQAVRHDDHIHLQIK